jgi:hypothetical protein
LLAVASSACTSKPTTISYDATMPDYET